MPGPFDFGNYGNSATRALDTLHDAADFADSVNSFQYWKTENGRIDTPRERRAFTNKLMEKGLISEPWQARVLARMINSGASDDQILNKLREYRPQRNINSFPSDNWMNQSNGQNYGQERPWDRPNTQYDPTNFGYDPTRNNGGCSGGGYTPPAGTKTARQLENFAKTAAGDNKMSFNEFKNFMNSAQSGMTNKLDEGEMKSIFRNFENHFGRNLRPTEMKQLILGMTTAGDGNARDFSQVDLDALKSRF